MNAEHDDLCGIDEGDAGHVSTLIAAFVLNALDPDDAERVRRHVADCSRCASELAGYEQTIEALPYAVPVQSVPLRSRAALLARIDQGAAAPVARAPRRSRRWNGWLSQSPRLAGAMAVPALLLLVALGVMGVRLYDQQQRLAEITAEQDRTVRTLAEAPTSIGSTYIAQFGANPNLASGAKAKLIVNRQTDSALILAVDLPIPADGQHYVAWMRFSNGVDYALGGDLRVDPDGGKATLVIQPFGWLASYDAVIVSVESSPPAGAPNGPVLMTAVIGVH